jgi:hypothetical protein
MKTFAQLLSDLNEARMVATGDYRISASGRKVRRLIKVGDDNYSKADDVDGDGDNDADDEKAKKMRGESVVPAHMQGKQKPYVSSDGKGNYEVLGNRGQTKATFNRKDHGTDAQKKAQAHLKSKYDEYMKEETELEEGVNKSDVPAYLRKKTGDQLTTKDLDKERTQNRSHPETIKKINGTDVKEAKDLDNACWKGFKAIGLKTKNGKKVPNCVPEEAQQEAYSMDDVRRDAADHLKKSIDKQSDDRIAALKDKKKPESFLAKVGRKQINMVKGAYHGLTKESSDSDADDVPFDKPYKKVDKEVTTDKSGAKHDAMSKARHLARMAIAQQKKKKQG